MLRSKVTICFGIDDICPGNRVIPDTTIIIG
jgi:hypothetical protein